MVSSKQPFLVTVIYPERIVGQNKKAIVPHKNIKAAVPHSAY